MTTEVPEQKVTAHQLWCNQVQEKIEAILWPEKISKGKHVIQVRKPELRKQYEEVIAFLNHFQNTKLRVHVDEVIKRLDLAKAECDRIKTEFESIHRLRFWKKKRLEREYRAAQGIMEAYQGAVLILVNTPPPVDHVEPKAVSKPKMKVIK